MTAREYLIQFGISVDAAFQWLAINWNSPETIYNLVINSGLDSQMLAEIIQTQIPGIESNDVENYFTALGFDGSAMRAESEITSTCDTVNTELSDQEIELLNLMIEVNDNTGLLSTASLKEGVLAQQVVIFNPENPFDIQTKTISATEYDAFFNHDDSENPVCHLPEELQGTVNTADSDAIFYGIMLNLFTSLDENEFTQLENVSDDISYEQSLTLLISILEDEANPALFSDQELYGFVTFATAQAIAMDTSGTGFNLETESFVDIFYGV